MRVQTKSPVLNSLPLTVSRSKTWGGVVWAVNDTYILKKGMAAGGGCGPGWAHVELRPGGDIIGLG